MSRRAHLDLGDFLPYLINRVGFALVRNFTRDSLAPHDLSIVMWRVLAALSNNVEQRLIDLADVTSIDVSTLSRLVTRLANIGIISRKRSKTSNREVLIGLTPRGRKMAERLIPIAYDLERTAIADIPARDLALVKRSLRRMYQNLAASDIAPRTRKRAAR